MNRAPIEKIEKSSEKFINIKIKEISEKNRAENIEKIRRIMMEGALNQLSFENCPDANDDNEKKNTEFEFYDF